MTAQALGYALIGRSYPSETFGGLYETSMMARRAHRGGVWAARRPRPALNAWLAARRAPVVPAVVRR